MEFWLTHLGGEAGGVDVPFSEVRKTGRGKDGEWGEESSTSETGGEVGFHLKHAEFTMLKQGCPVGDLI